MKHILFQHHFFYRWLYCIIMLMFSYSSNCQDYNGGFKIVTKAEFRKIDTLALEGTYFIQSQLKDVGTYLSQSFEIRPYKNGKSHGEYARGEIRFFERATETVYYCKVNYEHGVKNGYFFSSGEDYYEGNYVNGFKEGIWKEITFNSSFSTEFITYHRGKKEGLYEIIKRVGNGFKTDSYESGYYKNNLKEGKWYTLFPNGCHVKNYHLDTLNGIYADHFNKSGFYQGMYMNGVISGKGNSYSKKGEVIAAWEYQSGQVINKCSRSWIELDTMDCSNVLSTLSIPELVIEEKIKGFNIEMARQKIDSFRTMLTSSEPEFVKFYDSSRYTKSEGLLLNGKKEGKWLYRNDSCGYEASLEFKQGIREGAYNFKMAGYSVTGEFLQNFKNGKWTYYYRGKKPVIKFYKKGVLVNNAEE